MFIYEFLICFIIYLPTCLSLLTYLGMGCISTVHWSESWRSCNYSRLNPKQVYYLFIMKNFPKICRKICEIRITGFAKINLPLNKTGTTKFSLKLNENMFFSCTKSREKICFSCLFILGWI